MNENIKEIVNIIGNAELSNKCHKECFINTDFDNECTLCRQATALYEAGYRKQSDTVKEFAEKIIAVINDCTEDYLVSLPNLYTKVYVRKPTIISEIKQLAEQFGKEDL